MANEVELVADFQCGQWQTMEIPMPPSWNSMYRTFQNRMYRTASYVEWLKEAVAWMVRDLIPCRKPASIRIVVYGGKGFPESRDLDNCLKAIMDALKPPAYEKRNPTKLKKPGAGIIADDCVRYVREKRIQYVPRSNRKEEAEVRLFIAEVLE